MKILLIIIIILIAFIIWHYFRQPEVKTQGVASDFWAKFSPIFLAFAGLFAGMHILGIEIAPDKAVIVAEQVAIAITAIEAAIAVFKKKK